MKEDLLHFIWKYKKFQLARLTTSKNEAVAVLHTGMHNHLAGPDFFNAKINIGGQLWAGNVEIHVNASDWYAHRHEDDANYDSVILHVVWHDDVAVFRKDGTEIPTLELKNYISKEVLSAYQKLFDTKQKRFINCENDIAKIEDFVFQNWLERLYFERLEEKSAFIFELLEKSNNNWEQVLFALLLKNFGLNVNGGAFLSLANAIDFSVVRKLQADVFQLESVFMGMSHLLEDDTIVDQYYLQLKKEYGYLKHKFSLIDTEVVQPQFFKLRPPNFPTLRLSQLANVYTKKQHLFNVIVNTTNLEDLYRLFDVSASLYWNDHFTFGKTSKKSTKKLTKKFVDLLIINAIIPLKFCYAKHLGKEINEEIIQISTTIKAEDNSILSNFKKHGVQVKNAKDSQAMLQMYKKYCFVNRCLDCQVGSSLLREND